MLNHICTMTWNGVYLQCQFSVYVERDLWLLLHLEHSGNGANGRIIISLVQVCFVMCGEAPGFACNLRKCSQLVSRYGRLDLTQEKSITLNLVPLYKWSDYTYLLLASILHT